MRETSSQRWQINERIVPLFVLLVLVVYTYGILFVIPYAGFSYDNNGRVVEISSEQPAPTLQLGDKLVQIGNISWENYSKDSMLVFFEGVKAGEIVNIAIDRDGQEMVIRWKFAGFDQAVFRSRVFNLWEIAFIFWLAAAMAQVLIRPKDERRRLFIAANYITALWLIFGILSSRHLWMSSILLHAVTWLLLPVYLHFHWQFPRPLKELPKTVWWGIYAAGFVLAAAEFIQVLPKSLFALAFLVALLGSVFLEGIHFVRQPDQRRYVLILAIAIFVAFAPTVILGIFYITNSVPAIAPIAIVALPIMPAAYFYVVSRGQLGGLEVRFNRFISLYAFLILFGAALLFIVIPLTNMELNQQTTIIIGMVVLLIVAYLAITIFPKFQAFVDKRFLGIKLPYQNLQETYSGRIASSTSIDDLLQLLRDEVFPSLFIRQFAFMRVVNGKLNTLLSANVNPDQLAHENDTNKLILQAGNVLPFTSPAYGWARLILPLKVGEAFVGFWLLGRRDPDDLYPAVEIPILQSLASQTAIALSNSLHAQQLRRLFQQDVERYEQERLSLARELHDSVLNQLAVLRNNLGEAVPSTFQNDYEEVTRRLREIVSELRPPMLMYGLGPAIDELADNLMDRNNDKIKIHVDLKTSEQRVPEKIEQHLYRIVQESCENSLRHSHAKRIGIFGTLDSQKIDLVIEDDGTGFDHQLDIDNLINNNHFGLAGMVERAHLIGAEINFQSSPNAGVTIYISWADNVDKT